ncbi:M4 family metallopeptidase [Actinokineospora sp. 24-640]
MAQPGPAALAEDLPLLSEAEAASLTLSAIKQDSARFGYTPEQELVVRKVSRDGIGNTHVRVHRRYQGLDVIGGDLVLHWTAARDLQSVSRSSAQSIRLDSVKPRVTRQDAASTAAERAGFVAGTSTAELAVDASGNKPRLVWRATVEGTSSERAILGRTTILDAVTGDVVRDYQASSSVQPPGEGTGGRPKTASPLPDAPAAAATGVGTGNWVSEVPLATHRPAGNQDYQLKDTTRGNMITKWGRDNTNSLDDAVYIDEANVWGTNDDLYQRSGVDVHWGAARTWDFYAGRYGHTGPSDNGAAPLGIAHYGNQLANAIWNDRCFCMRFGEGDATHNPYTALDVVGHEYTHGVVRSTAGLHLYGEAGALNEASSDILGNAVEWANPTAVIADFEIGHNVDVFRGAIRRMDNPALFNNHFSCYSPEIANSPTHYGAGVADHWYYLMVNGSGAKTVNGRSYNSPVCQGPALQPSGKSALDIADLWYYALLWYGVGDMTYSDMRDATELAARGLFGSAVESKVSAAWNAVGVA